MSSRRNFIRTTGMISLGFLGLHKFAHGAYTSVLTNADGAGYGPLLKDPKGVLNLPKGFTYQIISKQGEKMNDGFFVPGKADGMATFKGTGNKTIIIRNHENSPGSKKDSPFGENYELLSKVSKQKIYDYGNGNTPCIGGTTTMVYNHQTKKVETQFLSLTGTIRNCAGGPTPWNSWISCEETTAKANEILERDHGYNFEVPATENINLVEPIPLKAMGRFNHEAVAVDPATSIVYLTEDDHESLIYRFLPRTPQQLSNGGKLQALAFKDQPSCDTRNWKESTGTPLVINQAYDVYWIDLEEIDSPNNDLRFRGFKDGAAKFARGEGMWYGRNEIYFACTSGGANKTGQVFRYKPSPNEGQSTEKDSPGKLELFAEPNDKDILKNCDNLTVAPWGDVVLCEDHGHPFVVGITPKGEYYKLAENVGYQSEFAGGCFSPDGSTFFVNIQGPGLTLAIEGPWKKS